MLAQGRGDLTRRLNGKYLITLANATPKLPEDGAEAPKHVGPFVI